MLKTVLVPIHQDGLPFIALAGVASAILFWIWTPLGWFGLVVTAWCVYFFRDPNRVTPVRDGLVVSAADGTVAALAKVPPPPELDMDPEPVHRVSVFLNVFDVHMNRAPVDGTVARRVYSPGKFLNAALDKASDENERLALRLDRDGAASVAVVLMAGLLARRIRCFASEGAHLQRGQRFGLIRFGSRADVYLPPEVEPLVCVGQRVVGGETVLADEGARESARLGEVR
ncbi:MAG: phosphatidylserine decarboxylase [Alphaproteobacteria bacterium]